MYVSVPGVPNVTKSSIYWREGVPPAEVIRRLEPNLKCVVGEQSRSHASEMGFSMGRLEELTNIADRAEMVGNVSP